MSRRRPVAPDSSVHPAIWLAAGAAAGLLVGLAVADRAPGSRRLIKGAKALLPALTGLLNLAGRGSVASALPAVADLAATAGAAWDDSDEDAEDWDEGEEDEASDDEEAVADDALDSRVLAAFDADPLLSTLPIEIEQVDEGTIHLDGVVPSARLVQYAVTIARGTPGVERVDHSMTVRRPRQPAAGGRSGR